jgi:hypothetical protein
MMLAVMLGMDRDAVICDLAETYGVLDYKALPVDTLATLCAGLHEDSRIKMRMMDCQKVDPSFALVRISDTLTVIYYMLRCIGGDKSADIPALYQDIMTGKQEPKHNTGFASIEEFEEARKRMLDNG